MDFLKRVRNIHQSGSYLSVRLCCLFFSVSNVVIFPVCEKLLMESHLDFAYIAGSKQHIVNPSFEATRCRDTSLIVTGNHIASKDVR